MKRLALFLLTVLVIYVIYFDLTKGTLPLPAGEEPVVDAMAGGENTVPYFEKKVSSGETVLSVVEKSINGPLSISISEVITDFKILNDGLSPEKIKSGYIYKFPDYR